MWVSVSERAAPVICNTTVDRNNVLINNITIVYIMVLMLILMLRVMLILVLPLTLILISNWISK